MKTKKLNKHSGGYIHKPTIKGIPLNLRGPLERCNIIGELVVDSIANFELNKYCIVPIYQFINFTNTIHETHENYALLDSNNNLITKNIHNHSNLQIHVFILNDKFEITYTNTTTFIIFLIFYNVRL